MDNIELNMKLTYDELYEFNKKFVINAFFNLVHIMFIIYIFVLLMPAFINVRLILGRDDYLGYLVIILIVDITSFIARMFNTRKSSKNFLKYNSLYSKDKKIIITRDGMKSFYKNATFFIEWDNYKKILESKSLYKLIASDGCVSYISKVAFKNEEQLAFFKECTANIKKG